MKTSSYEEKIIKILKKEEVSFQREKIFKGLKRKRFDFFLPEKQIIIEVDGEYHFAPIKRKRQEFLKHQENDRIKNSFCLRNGLALYRIPFWEINHVNSLADLTQDKFLVKSKWHNDNLRGDFILNDKTRAKHRAIKNSRKH